MIPFGAGSVMTGRGYTVFDTGIGRCGIAWGDNGVIGVQLPEAREIETRRRLFRLYPDARELRPPLNVEIAIEGIVALLRGEPSDLSDVTLDMNGIPAFNARVYQFTRTIPRGETRTYGEVAAVLAGFGRGAFGRAGDFPQSLHDHRALPSRARGRQLCRQDFAERRQPSPSAGCCRSRAPAARAARPCSTCCFPLPRPARRAEMRLRGSRFNVIFLTEARARRSPSLAPCVPVCSASAGLRTRGAKP